MPKKKITCFAALLFALPFTDSTSYAANWQEVERNQTERIDIDKSRIARIHNNKAVAWSRLLLGRNLPLDENAGSYNAVEALNRYDCANQRFATLKRIYLHNGKIVQQEKIASPRELNITADSIDARLFEEVCAQRVVAQATAETSPVIASDIPAKAMYADVIQRAEENKSADKSATLRTVSTTAPAAHAAPANPVPKAPLPTSGTINIPSRAELAAKAAAEAAGLETPPAAPAASAAHSVPPAAPVAPATASKYTAARPAPALTPPTPASAPQALTSHPTAPTATAPTAATVPPNTRPTPAHTPSYAHEPVRTPRIVRKKTTASAPPIVAEPSINRHIHWSYEGEGGPANWSKLRPDYASCGNGKRQSPIDIREGVRVDLENIKFDYQPSLFRVIDNGHTIQVNVGEGNRMTLQDHQYDLVQFHFHRPAEERINGKTYDMVAHLVHKDLDGRLAVVAVLLEKGTEHPLIQSVWNNLPLEVNLETTPSTAIDLNRLLPEKRAYWTYMGSLTTPPCSEGVLWIVLKQPQQISPEQIAIFSRLYRNNARPIQGSNSRLIKESR